ncbi:LOW QUALITY PROTEIN: hypothetical protein ACHAWF_000390, partial [Thalassiosira exigua]
AEEASKKETCTPLGGIACDNFDWIVNCWVTEKEEATVIVADTVLSFAAEEKESNKEVAEKKRKWKETKRAVEEAAIAASLASPSADEDASAPEAAKATATTRPGGSPSSDPVDYGLSWTGVAVTTGGYRPRPLAIPSGLDADALSSRIVD